jgi:hypothetical protein
VVFSYFATFLPILLVDERIRLEELLSEHSSNDTNFRHNLPSSSSPASSASSFDSTSEAYELVKNSQFLMLFIASDNSISSNQILQVTNYSHSLLSPAGCHVEWDRSWECFSLTVRYWFMMSISKHIVTQQISEGTLIPTSSFSRYAGIYGLKNNPFRIGKHCKMIVQNKESSRVHHNNWYC